jgi:hypothetical protein
MTFDVANNFFYQYLITCYDEVQTPRTSTFLPKFNSETTNKHNYSWRLYRVKLKCIIKSKP